jgi:two-component system LytT family response regulator
MRILVVDDEPLARERLRVLLASERDAEIIGECSTAGEAIAAIAETSPDVVLLDINLPGATGIDVAAAIPEVQRPAIIFVTAHERYAVNAFGVNAIDFVLKPFDRDRLLEALRRVGTYLHARRGATLEARLESWLERRAPERKRERFCVKTGGCVVFIRPDEIRWIEAANNYSIIHLSDGRRVMTRESIGTIEERLDAADFVRISRSAIVSVDQVQELRPTEHGDYTVVLRNGLGLPLSRQLRGRLDVFLPSQKL